MCLWTWPVLCCPVSWVSSSPQGLPLSGEDGLGQRLKPLVTVLPRPRRLTRWHCCWRTLGQKGSNASGLWPPHPPPSLLYPSSLCSSGFGLCLCSLSSLTTWHRHAFLCRTHSRARGRGAPALASPGAPGDWGWRVPPALKDQRHSAGKGLLPWAFGRGLPHAHCPPHPQHP